MAELNETPRGNRIHIAFFGLRNAGKSTLVNAFTGQPLAIVSDVAGTTTDPVSKAMEILPLGPCLVTDTAGLDDEGELGEQRVKKSLDVLATTDIAIWVWGENEKWKIENGECGTADPSSVLFRQFLDTCKNRNVTVLEYRRGDSVEELKKKIAELKLVDRQPDLLEGLVSAGDRVICVVPIDESAPKGRLILPQQQVIRECLDRHLACTVCQPEELGEIVESSNCRIVETPHRKILVITDSQAFGKVHQVIDSCLKSQISNLKSQTSNLKSQTSNLKSQLSTFNLQPSTCSLTSFSILFARQKGDLEEYERGLDALSTLKDGDTVLIAEGCTHHRQCNDIGSVKIPKALAKLTGKKLRFVFSCGTTFFDSSIRQFDNSTISLVVHCGGCMLTRREVQRRIGLAKEAGIPIVNYGMLLGKVAGITPPLSHFAT